MADLKLLTEVDAVQFRALRLKSFKESPFAFSESYEDEKHKDLHAFSQEIKIEGRPPEQFILGAFDENSILIGFVKFRRDKRSKARHKSMIHAMYVEPAFRNRGVGLQLVEELTSRVRQLEGLEQIHLWVLHASETVSGFYKKCGFESQGTMVKNDLKIGDTYIHAEYMVMYL